MPSDLKDAIAELEELLFQNFGMDIEGAEDLTEVERIDAIAEFLEDYDG